MEIRQTMSTSNAYILYIHCIYIYCCVHIYIYVCFFDVAVFFFLYIYIGAYIGVRRLGRSPFYVRSAGVASEPWAVRKLLEMVGVNISE